ncbi:MAG: radical SAM protein [Archangiaceae bacterium]|nr:radical SAM protein [Archangiaceae bacterium]
MHIAPDLDARSLYRLPWTDSDNVLSWLEPTTQCNLACEGCYRENAAAHKSLAEVRKDLDVFNRLRNFDSVSIAGGDPLLHPELAEIVKMVAADGHKPVINTNGLALTEDKLRELKDAGLIGLTFHIDSKQGRPGWKKKNELELNELRLKYAEMVGRVGGLSCAFNATVYEDTLKDVPELVKFAEDHIDLIDVMVFIVYRAAVRPQFAYFKDGKEVVPDNLVYSVEEAEGRVDLSSGEVVRKIRERFPDFSPSAYLGGTEKPDSMKWLYTGRFGFKGKTLGYVGPRFMEYVQNIHHALTGKYVAYAPKGALEAGRSALAMGLVEPGVRNVAKNYARHLLAHPLDLKRKLHFQTIMIIQPIDLLADGRANMCDGCPDVTVHDGQLVWSCRLEEYRKYGGLLQCVPRSACGPQRARPQADIAAQPAAAAKTAAEVS